MMKKPMKIRESFNDRIFLTIVYIVLTIILIVTLFPLINVVASSFSSSNAVVTGRVNLWPVEFNTEAYRVIFESPKILRAYANSFFYTITATALQVALTVMIGYPLARRRLMGRGVISGILVFTMFFSGGLIPTYMVVRSLGMVNTRLAMIIPPALSVYQIIITRAFFINTLSEELFEAAEIDGYSEFGIFLKIVLPLSTAIIAVLTLIYAIGNWNSYFDAMIYLNSEELFPLQIILRSLLIQNTQPGRILTDARRIMRQREMATLLKYALIVVASVPVLAFYPFIQKYFVRGVMVGSLKG